MTDRYASFAASGPGRALVKRLGLPNPPRLHRYRTTEPLTTGPVLLGGQGRLYTPLGKLIESMGVELRDPAARTADADPPPNAALVFDATSVTDSTRLRALYD